jgi:hypothetical protein
MQSSAQSDMAPVGSPLGAEGGSGDRGQARGASVDRPPTSTASPEERESLSISRADADRIKASLLVRKEQDRLRQQWAKKFSGPDGASFSGGNSQESTL